MNYPEVIQNHDLLHEMSLMLAPSVHNPKAVIQGDVERHCNRVHLVFSMPDKMDSTSTEKLAGFVGYGRISVELPGNLPGVKSPVFYFGFGNTSPIARSWRLPELAARHFLEDLQFFLPQGTELWGCVMAAVPTGMKAGFEYFKNREGYPRVDGSYTEESVGIARAIAKAKGWESMIDPNYPFLLRGVSSHVHFTDEEIHRTEQICTKNGISVFQKAGLNIHTGDRILFVGKIMVE